jgi:hypothetical protein
MAAGAEARVRVGVRAKITVVKAAVPARDAPAAAVVILVGIFSHVEVNEAGEAVVVVKDGVKNFVVMAEDRASRGNARRSIKITIIRVRHRSNRR